MFDNGFISLNPLNFFSISADCQYLTTKDRIPSTSSYRLPDTNSLSHEYTFAKVSMGWHEEGLGFFIQVDQKYIKSYFPDVQKGDSIELFIDTRDLKSAGFNTRFCHHFFFLPEAVEDRLCGEITRFRTEDNHPLCDSQLLLCETKLEKDSYKMKIFIPAQCLVGYDPRQFNRVGFTYRINRMGGNSQHFSVLSQDYQIDQNPSLWGSLQLVK